MKFSFLVLLLATVSAAQQTVAPQVPSVFIALNELGGYLGLTTEQQQEILKNAVAGQDYPINALATSSVDCSKKAQAGFYADTSSPSDCQVFSRCDDNGVRTDYLCPNETLFNQITLICDWFFNVNCSLSAQFDNYSNPRIEIQNALLLDTPPEVTQAALTALVATAHGPHKHSVGTADASAVPAALSKSNGGSYLLSNDQLIHGDYLYSQNGCFLLWMQNDGNLVLYRISNARALWATRTNGRGGWKAIMQSDGNFVVYNANNRALWASNTQGHAGDWIVMQNDGNLVIYNRSGPLWASNTVSAC